MASPWRGLDRQRQLLPLPGLWAGADRAGRDPAVLPPYRPQTNGKVERFNLTLKLEWAYATVYASNQARLDHLAWWLHHYNHHRPHTAHQGAAPMTAVNNLPAKHT
jgi:transposase InsO family protein